MAAAIALALGCRKKKRVIILYVVCQEVTSLFIFEW